MKNLFVVIFLCVFWGPEAFANRSCALSMHPDIELSVKSKLSLLSRVQISTDKVIRSVANSHGEFKTITASPEEIYQYEWRRDSALVSLALESVMDFFHRFKSGQIDEVLQGRLPVLEKLHQNKDFFKAGLGEPKVELDLSPFNDKWGRPQNDGPALNALLAFRLAERYSQDAGRYLNIARGEILYLLENVKKPSFDYWEEVKGKHFHVMLVQLKALLKSMDHPTLLSFSEKPLLDEAVDHLKKELDLFWDPVAEIIRTTRDRVDGIIKTDEIDISTILGLLHDGAPQYAFSVMDPRVVSTVLGLEREFASKYDLPDAAKNGLAMVRYLQDVWNGKKRSHPGSGQAWFLANHAMAEFYFTYAQKCLEQGFIPLGRAHRRLLLNIHDVNMGHEILMVARSHRSIDPVQNRQIFEKVIKTLMLKGESFLVRTGIHMADDGSMSEQFNPAAHDMQGPRDLNWSYGSFLTAARSYYLLRQSLEGF